MLMLLLLWIVVEVLLLLLLITQFGTKRTTHWETLLHCCTVAVLQYFQAGGIPAVRQAFAASERKERCLCLPFTVTSLVFTDLIYSGETNFMNQR